jgi:ABC-2 type transport system ATP-binding protein
MIRTEALTKWFGSRRAVDHFDVEIRGREIVGFLGLNGAGKTTALRMLAGLLAPSAGRVLIDGQDLAGPGGHRARARIGFLPDRPPLYEEMTVKAFLGFAARLRGHVGGPARVAEVLERTGLVAYADEPIAHLSHGYRQRAGIAQAIVHDPALVILDEPMSGLDPRQIVDMRALVRNLAEDHTVLLSSHNLTEVSETCDQILVIDDGRLVAQGAPEELAAKLGGDARRFELTLVGSEATLADALDAARSAEHIDAHERRSEGDTHFVTIDVRTAPEEAARVFFEAGLGLRRMEAASTPLEGLFAELTRRAS